MTDFDVTVGDVQQRVTVEAVETSGSGDERTVAEPAEVAAAFAAAEADERVRWTGRRVRRPFEEFFVPQTVEVFWEMLEAHGVKLNTGPGATVIRLREFAASPAQLVEGLEVLIHGVRGGTEVDKTWNRHDRFAVAARHPYLVGGWQDYHEAVFQLPRKYPHVWVAGRKRYGLRVATVDHPHGVSLLTGVTPERFWTGQAR